MMKELNLNLNKLDLSRWMILMNKLLRTKEPDQIEQISTTKLEKCLKTRDLVSLGVGSCVGTGMYLVAGMVAKNLAGPAVIFSFLIAGIASLLSGVCYAEFGVRVPNTSGSAYMYSYVTVGEFIAFVIGWNMILEYLIGTAAGAAAISACIDAMYSGSMKAWIRMKLGTFVGHTPDLFAAFLAIMMAFILATGVKKSLLFTNVLNVINFAVWFFILAASLFYIDFDNWSEHGGFAPYGWSGVLNGAATCFYAFIGFDIIATTGEEAENPQRSIPTAIVSSMIIALVAYISSGLVVTLLVPYSLIDTNSPIIEMFSYVGANRCKFFAAIGALAGLFVSMFGSMFPMPRVVYAMAKDGLLFSEFAQISPLTNTPVKSTLIFGSLTAFVALIMSLEVLVEMMSIGTLMAYTLVSACVLLLRYQPTKTNLIELLPQSIRSACVTPCKEMPPTIVPQPYSNASNVAPQIINQVSRQQCYAKPVYDSSESEETDPNWSRQGSKDDEFLVPGTAGLQYGSVPYQHGGSSSRRYGILDKYEKLLVYLFPYGWKVNTPATEESGMYVARLVGTFLLLAVLFDVLLAWHINSLQWNQNRFLFLFFMFLLISIIIIILAISRQPQIRCNLKFKAPGVPFVPAIAIIINIYLILRLSILTLVRFTVWMTIGLFIYFGYGIKHSILELSSSSSQQQQNDTTNNNNNNNQTNACEFNGLSTTSATASSNVAGGFFSHFAPSSTSTTMNTIELKIPDSKMEKTFGSSNVGSSSRSGSGSGPSKPKPPIPPRPPRMGSRQTSSNDGGSFQRQQTNNNESFDSSKNYQWETFD